MCQTTISQIEQIIEHGNIDNLKNLIKQIQENKININSCLESPNLIISACKNNRAEILKYLLANHGEVLNQINGQNNFPLPNDIDKYQHNAFYYAIRSGNSELLKTLITDWPDPILSNNNSEMLEDILSKAYEEVKLKNIVLSDEIQVFVESQMIDLSFLSNKTQMSPKRGASQSPLDNIKKSINFTIELITLLSVEFASDEHEINDRFFFLAKCTAQNIYVLKRQLKSTYKILPWEEMEFCLICFICSHKTQHEINLFYHSTLNKTKILKYLNLFAEKLNEVMNTHLHKIKVGKIAELPKLSRDKVIADILRVSPQFKELYNDHQQIRDIHSLTKISEYIKLSMNVDPKNREGQLVITRVLQAFGEYFKNSLESPKLSEASTVYLFKSLSNNTKKIITDLRNSLNHAFSLSQRKNIENNNDVKFFIGIQEDFKKLSGLIADVLRKKTHNSLKVLLKQLIVSNFSETTKEVWKIVERCFNLNDIAVNTFKNDNHIKIQKLITSLRDIINFPTNQEIEMFKKIDDLIKVEKEDSDKSQEVYQTACISIKTLLLYGVIDDQLLFVKGFERFINYLIDNITPDFEEEFKFKSITHYANKICESCISRIQNDEQMIKDVYTIQSDINFVASFGKNDVKCMKELNQKINLQFPAIRRKENQQNKLNSDNKKYNEELKRKLHQLKCELDKGLAANTKNITEIYSSYKCNTKLQAIVELLLLDILNILGDSKICLLQNNFLSFNECSPLLTGKNLRNHLAHDNILVDLLLTDPSLSIILNANKLVTENLIADKKIIGKLLQDDLAKVKYNFNWGLMIIESQKRMLENLQNGNFDEFICCLENGADIFARCRNMRTTLHYAAIGGNLEIVEYLCKQNVPSDARDNYYKTAFHLAAEYGRTSIVEFFLNNHFNSIDQQTEFKETSLHLAAGNGHTDTVECLLKHKASTKILNCADLVPLQKAVIGGHKSVMELLLGKEDNVDVIDSLNLLHLASKSRNPDVVLYFVEKNAKVNSNDYMNGETPLHLAAQYGHLAIVNILIENKANVNSVNNEGCTALHYAAENGNDKIFKALLKHGADINAVEINKFTPLHCAVQNKHKKVVDTCLKNGANADLRTQKLQTPLHFAVSRGNLKIINALLKSGVQLNCKDIQGFTPLHYAGMKCSLNKEIADTLLNKGAMINVRNNSNLTPLHLACMVGNTDLIELFATSGAAVDAADNDNETPMHKAVLKGKIDAIKVLVRNKANVNVKNKQGLTSLFLAASNDHCDIMEYLLENNAKENKCSTPDFVSINSAIVQGHVDVVKLLLQHRSKINDRGMNEGSTLVIAVNKGNIDIVKILIENGANVDPKGMGDKSPLCHAIHLNRKQIVKLLVSNGANVDGEFGEPIYTAIFDGHIDIFEYLLSKNARITSQMCGQHALHLAVCRGHKSIVSTLIRHGTDVNFCDLNNPDKNKRFSPLHLAVGMNYNEITEILLEHGANINQNSSDGTPLHIAVCINNFDGVKLMVKSGKAKMDIKSKDDYTILHIAAENGNLEMVKYLIANGCSIDARTSKQGSKAIHCAAKHGFVDIVAFLHKTGSSVNEINFINQTPLHMASLFGHLKVAEYLIANKACIDARAFLEVTPLCYAVQKGHINIAELLLKNGAMYNAMDAGERRILNPGVKTTLCILLIATDNLFKGVKINNRSCVENALKDGAFINSKNYKGYTPLCYASRKGFIDIVRILLKNKANPNALDLNGLTSLHYALKLSHIDVVKVLLENGASYDPLKDTHITSKNLIEHKDIVDLLLLNQTTPQNQKTKQINVENKVSFLKPHSGKNTMITVTHPAQQEIMKYVANFEEMKKAITNDNMEILKELMAKKFDVIEVEPDGKTLLHYAVHSQRINIVKFLLANGFDVIKSTNKGNTPLHIAVLKSNKEIVKILLQHTKSSELKEFINAKTTVSGATALHVAVTKKGSLDIVKLLLKYGAAYDTTNYKNESPLELSIDPDVKSLLKLIHDLNIYVKCGNLEAIHILKTLKNTLFSIAMNARNDQGFTLLEIASLQMNKTIYDLLIQILQIRDSKQL